MADGTYGRLLTVQDAFVLATGFGKRVAEAAVRARFAGEELPDGWGQDALREVLEEAERDGVLTFPADKPLFLLRGQDGIAAEAVSFLRAPGAVPPRVRRPATE